MIYISTIREYRIAVGWAKSGQKNVVYMDPDSRLVLYQETTYPETGELRRYAVVYKKGVYLIITKTAETSHDEYYGYGDFDFDVAECGDELAVSDEEALEYMIEMIVATIEEGSCSGKENVRQDLRRALLSEKCV